MPLAGLRNTQWPQQNADRRYPLVPTASAKSVDALFEITNDCLLNAKLAVPWDPATDPTSFYIRAVSHTDSEARYTLAVLRKADPSDPFSEFASLDVGYFRLPYTQTNFPLWVSLVPTAAEVFISGELQFGNLPHGQPFGDFTFLRDETQLELSLVRPSLLSLLDITIHGVPLTGQLNFFAGENTRLRYEIIDDEPHLFIDATDREVLVTNCECGGESVDPITMLNGIPAASDGSFTLLEGECITATPGRHSVSLNNPCSDPCCGCKESAALEASITPLGSQVKTVAGFSERLGSEIEALGFASLRTDLGRHCDLWAEPPDIPEELKNEP